MRSNRIKTLGLALVVVFALGAVVVASASAQITPGLGRCVKVAAGTGKYTTAKCTTAGTGEYEWEAGPGTEKAFTSTGEKAVLEIAVAKTTVKCKKVENTGEYVNEKEFLIIVTFTGCENNAGQKCQNGVSEEIKTNSLKGLYGVIKAPTELGVSLEAAVSGKTLATFTCGSGTGKEEVKVTGSVIAPVSPVNEMTLKETETFKQKEGKQEPERFEGGALDVLTTEIPEIPLTEQSGQEVTAKITNKEKLEIRGEA